MQCAPATWFCRARRAGKARRWQCNTAPEDKYLPSYLVLARHGSEVFHVLFAVDVEGDNVRVVTSYRPDPMEWQPDMTTRRQRP